MTRVSGTASADISQVGLGTAALAAGDGSVTDELAVAAIRTAFEEGIRMFDTAPLYGFGTAERRVGSALSELPRDQVVLSTKVGNRVNAAGELVFGFDRDGVLRSIEESLTRLGTDRLDIVHVHERQNRTVMTSAELAEPLPTLHELRDQKVIGQIGLGVNRWDITLDLVRDGGIDLVLLAGHLNLIDCSAADSFLPLCVEHDVGVIAAGAYATGILATGPVPGATYRYRPAPANIRRRTAKIADLCAEFGIPLSAAALQFPLRHPGVKAVAAGAASPDQVTTMSNDARRTIPDELWEAIAVHAERTGDALDS